MNNLIAILIVIAFVISGCAGSQPSSGNDDSRREYNTEITIHDNTAPVEVTIGLDLVKEEERDISSDSEGGNVTPTTDLDMALSQSGSTASLAAAGATQLLNDISSNAQYINKRIEQLKYRVEEEEKAKEEKPKTPEGDDKSPEPGEDGETGETKYEKYYHHTTTASSDGGKSLVLCPGDPRTNMKCKVGDVNIPYHGTDTGRHSYWNMKAEPKGDIVCDDNGITRIYRASGTNQMGSCKAEDKPDYLK